MLCLVQAAPVVLCPIWCVQCLQGFVDPEDWTFLLTGGLGDAGTIPNPATDWLQDRAWKELGRLAQMPGFKVSPAYHTCSQSNAHHASCSPKQLYHLLLSVTSMTGFPFLSHRRMISA